MHFYDRNDNNTNEYVYGNGIWKDLLFRKNPQEAFDNAVKKGMKHPNSYMYMYSDIKYDYFKHICTRQYTSYRHSKLIKILINTEDNNVNK